MLLVLLWDAYPGWVTPTSLLLLPALVKVDERGCLAAVTHRNPGASEPLVDRTLRAAHDSADLGGTELHLSVQEYRPIYLSCATASQDCLLRDGT